MNETKTNTTNTAKTDNSWRRELILNARGEVENCLSNFSLIVKNDNVIADTLKLDDFDGRYYIVTRPAWVPESMWRGRRPAESYDFSEMAFYIERNYGIKIQSMANIERIVRDAAAISPKGHVSRIIDTIKAVKWDGRPRAESYFIDTMGIEDTSLNRACTVKFLMAAVLRQMHPGLKFDTVPVFISEQGIGKSSALKALAMFPNAFVDDVKDFTSRDEVSKFATSWIVELAEAAATKAADIDRLKAFITSTSDLYRAPYAHESTEHPRRCVMAITTNNRVPFLRDKTGNRRYWIMVAPKGATPKIKAEPLCPGEFGDQKVNEYILQVWAEVMFWIETDDSQSFAELRSKLILNQEQREEMNQIVSCYTVRSEEEDALRVYLSEYSGNRICSQILWEEALDLPGRPSIKTDKAAYYAIQQVLSTLPGWHCVNKRGTLHYTDRAGRNRSVKPAMYWEKDEKEPTKEETTLPEPEHKEPVQLSEDFWANDDPIIVPDEEPEQEPEGPQVIYNPDGTWDLEF